MQADPAVIKVRWWPRSADVDVASTRLRCLLVLRQLRSEGVDAAIWTKRESLRHRNAPDVLVLGKRYDSASMATALELRRISGTRIVLDLCDNHFFAEPMTPPWRARAEQLRSACSLADAVVASTEALAEVVRIECPSAPVHVIGDAVEPPVEQRLFNRLAQPMSHLRLWCLKRELARVRRAGGVGLIWFGNHGSPNVQGGMLDLLHLEGALRALKASMPVILTIVSNNHAKFTEISKKLPVNCRYLPWSAELFSAAARAHDIAVIPVRTNPFSRCKTNNRLATALVHGLAVAADSIPSYREFSDSAVLDDWEIGLQRLAAEPMLRRSLVDAGQARLARDWSIESIASKWQSTLVAVAQSGHVHRLSPVHAT